MTKNLTDKIKEYLKKPIAVAGLTALLAFGGKELYAKDIHVPEEYQAIQSAIDVSEEGDRVLVAPGEYIINEPITYRGKNIILKSEEGSENTIICLKDFCETPWGPYSVILFVNGETTKAVLDGFTITGACRAYDGGGIYCNGSSPTIINNIITENIARRSGGGIACLSADPLIKSNVISKNMGSAQGGGIYCENSKAEIIDNIIKENSVWGEDGGGIHCRGVSPIIIKGNCIIDNFAYEQAGGITCIPSGLEMQSKALIKNNIIARNRSYEHGCGIVCTDCVDIIGNTIVGNSAGYASGGVLGQEGNLLLNNIIWANTPTDLSGIQLSNVSYCDISQEGFAGIHGNISADPLLVNPNPDPNTLDNLINNGDFDGAMKYLTRCFSLQPNSPCIDAGYDEYSDPDCSRADIGAIYFDRRDPYRDGFIDFKDYAELLRNWQKSGSELEGDIDKNGTVDYEDLETLSENWLSVVPVYGGCED